MLYTHLQYRPLDDGPPKLINGKTLLFLLQREIERTQRGGVVGNGLHEAPWRLRSASAWLDCADGLTRTAGDRYLIIAGRMLCKDARIYISDLGPAWRYLDKINPHGPTPAYRMTEALFDTPDEIRAYNGDAPTYQMAAQRVVRPHTVFPRTARMDEDAPGWRVPNAQERPRWNDVAFTPMLVSAMRVMLKGEKLTLGGNNGRYSPHYSRMQHSLPVLTAAMFLAEPARNIRAFPINLMLLDLAEDRVVLDANEGSHFTVDRILWHPDALDINSAHPDPSGDLAPSHPVVGPATRENRTVQPVTERKKLHLVGGEMPSSPTRGGEIGGSREFALPPLPDQSHIPVDKRAKARDGWLRGQLRIQNYDYIFQKEVSVIVRWLAHQRPYTFAAVNAALLQGQPVEVPDWDVLFTGAPDAMVNPQTRVDLRDIEVMFRMRLDSLDHM